MEFSLLFFSGDGSTTKEDKYRLLLESAKFADQNGFSAIWTPERHFSAFGGIYPNPAVIGAALATITERIKLRAGSVVLPLQNPIRVAEEWSVVDNLSKGRVSLSFASGWHADDFVLLPENYTNRKQSMWSGIQLVKKLWSGESVEFTNGTGNRVKITTFPRPIQSQPSIWITCQSPETFVEAGKIGANILTSLLYETIEDAAAKITLYRQSLDQHGYDPHSGKVALMLHTFLGKDAEAVKQQVKPPFCRYLKTHFELVRNLVRSLNLSIDIDKLTQDDIDSLLLFGCDRYLNGRTLIGTPTTCLSIVEQARKAGVNEMACLIDFGLDFETVMTSLSYLKDLKNRCYATSQYQAV